MRRWGFLAGGLAAALALASCADSGLGRYNPLKDVSLPSLDLGLDDLSLPDLSLPTTAALGDATFAATDILPEFAFGRRGPVDVDAGVGGYTGAVDRQAAPQLPPLGTLRGFQFAVRVFGSGADYAVRGLGSTTTLGQDRLWQLEVVSFEDRHRRLVSLRPPIVAASMTASDTAASKGLAVAFPAVAASRAPQRGSPEYEALAESLRSLSAPLAAESGEAERIGRPAALERLVRAAKPPASDTTAGRIVGTASVEGRRAAVALYDGEAAYVDGANRLTFAAKGHALIDLESGLALASTVRLRRTGSLDGRRVADEVTIETAIRPVRPTS